MLKETRRVWNSTFLCCKNPVRSENESSRLEKSLVVCLIPLLLSSIARAVQQTAFWLIHSIIESKTIFQAVNPAFSFNPLPPSHQKILTRSQRKSKSLITTNPLAAERANPVFQDNSAITVVIICNDGCQGQSCAVICPALWSSHEGHSYSAHGLSRSERGVKELPLLTFTEKKYKIQ